MHEDEERKWQIASLERLVSLLVLVVGLKNRKFVVTSARVVFALLTSDERKAEECSDNHFL